MQCQKLKTYMETGRVIFLPARAIRPNPAQPRKIFREDALNELADWVETRKWNLSHWFTVDDLRYLKRGGRISAATALVGTMLNIKPVLHVDEEGRLVSVTKTRGRRASIQALLQQMEASMLPGENDTAFICHGDCLEDAQLLASLVKERCGVKEVFIGYTGAVIGSHSGPGTLALFFLGSQR